jgi:hypothetical protein
MAASKSMRNAQSNDFLVFEAHSAEDVSQVLVTLASIWKSSIGCAGCNVFI